MSLKKNQDLDRKPEGYQPMTQKKNISSSSKKIKIREGAPVIYTENNNITAVLELALTTNNIKIKNNPFQTARAILLHTPNNSSVLNINLILYRIYNDLFKQNNLSYIEYKYDNMENKNFIKKLTKKKISFEKSLDSLDSKENEEYNIFYDLNNNYEVKEILSDGNSTGVLVEVLTDSHNNVNDNYFQEYTPLCKLSDYDCKEPLSYIINFDKRLTFRQITENTQDDYLQDCEYIKFQKNCQYIYSKIFNIAITSDAKIYVPSTTTHADNLVDNIDTLKDLNIKNINHLSKIIRTNFSSLPENTIIKGKNISDNIYEFDTSKYNIGTMLAIDGLKTNPFKSANISYLLWGYPRLWLIINTIDNDKLYHALSNEFPQIASNISGAHFTNNNNDNTNEMSKNAQAVPQFTNYNIIQMLDEGLILLNIDFFQKYDIPIQFILQEPGESLFLREGVYYQYVNMGVNFSENIYFLPPSIRYMNMRVGHGLPISDTPFALVKKRLRKMLCQFCSNSFFTSEELNRHYFNEHDIDYTVEQCKKCHAYVFAKNLFNHMTSRHFNRIGLCIICHTFVNDIRVHIKKVHDTITINLNVFSHKKFLIAYNKIAFKIIKTIIESTKDLNNNECLIYDTNNIQKITVSDIIQNYSLSNIPKQNTSAYEQMYYQAKKTLYNLALMMSTSESISKTPEEIKNFLDNETNFLDEAMKKRQDILLELVKKFSNNNGVQLRGDNNAVGDVIDDNQLGEDYKRLIDFCEKIKICKLCNKNNFTSYKDFISHTCKQYKCKCGKIYFHRATLWRHKKQCNHNLLSDEDDNDDGDDGNDNESSDAISQQPATPKCKKNGSSTVNASDAVLQQPTTSKSKKTESSNVKGKPPYFCKKCNKKYSYFGAYVNHVNLCKN